MFSVSCFQRFDKRKIEIGIEDVRLEEKDVGPEWTVRHNDGMRYKQIKGKGTVKANVKCECGLEMFITSEIKNGRLYFASCNKQ